MIKRIILGVFLILIGLFSFFIDGVNRRYYPTPGYDVTLIPDQTGKIAIITGGTTGIGRSSAEQLCNKGAKLVIITSRSQTSADKAAKEIQQQYCSKYHQSKVIGKALALEDHKSIKEFAEWFSSLNEPLHILMLSAGLVAFDGERTSLGLDKTVGVNWFGHFYLQQLLQDIVEKSAPSRIVMISSKGASLAPPITEPIDKYVEIENAKGATQYTYSKLFNVYHANELHRRLREKGINNVYVNSLSPGFVATNIFEKYFEGSKSSFHILKDIFLSLVELLGLPSLDGALTQLYLATSPDVETLNISGEYFYPIARREDKSWYYFGKYSYLSPQARDPALAKKVWEYGESLIAKLPKE